MDEDQKPVTAGLLKEVLTQALADQSRDFRDFVRQENAAQDIRTDAKLDTLKTEILEGIMGILDTSVHPEIAQHEVRIDTLEKVVFVEKV